jgi:GMP synthase-like glutamine amidotransferase
VRALFIQQDHVSPIGPLGEGFVERGFDVEEFLVVPPDRFDSPDIDVAFPDPLDYDVVVPMGAVWSVYDVASVSWIADQVSLLRRAHDNGVPVFGVCFGGQALAAALGGQVQHSGGEEIGWVTVETDDPGLLPPGPWFHWHSDKFLPPPGARVVARSPLCPQAFVLGHSLGVQFHPEITSEELVGWLDNGGRDHLVATGRDEAALLASLRDIEAESAQRTRTLVSAFLDQVAFVSDRV